MSAGIVAALVLQPNGSSLNTTAKTVVEVAAPMVPGLLEKDVQGPYLTLIEYFNNNDLITLDIDIMPVRRAERSIINKTKDCQYLGVSNLDHYVNAGLSATDILISDPINTLSIMVYRRLGEPTLTSYSELEGLIFAAERGVQINFANASTKRPANARILWVENVSAAFELLQAGRVDAVISFSLDAELYMHKQVQAPNFHTDHNFALSSVDEAMVCLNTPTGRMVVDRFNKILKHLKKNGVFARLFPWSFPHVHPAASSEANNR